MAETRPQLSDVEQRVLGALLEKQRTVPASYPLTPNALRAACNQSSSREPVTDYDDSLLQATLAVGADRPGQAASPSDRAISGTRRSIP